MVLPREAFPDGLGCLTTFENYFCIRLFSIRTYPVKHSLPEREVKFGEGRLSFVKFALCYAFVV